MNIHDKNLINNLRYNQHSKQIFHFLRKRHLASKEFDTLFDIISNNMQKLGFHINNNDKLVWINNLKQNLRNDNFYMYLIYFNGEICGFIELVESENDLVVSEIQFNPLVKGSKLILHVINFVLNNPKFTKYTSAKFSINKNNTISNRTFTHLGGEICDEKGNSYTYKIERIKVQKYLDNLTKNNRF